MKKFFILILIVSTGFGSFAQKGSISGTVVNKDSSKPIEGVKVYVDQKETFTDAEGKFSLKEIEYGDYTINFESEDFNSFSTEVKLDKPELMLNEISLSPAAVITFNENDVITGELGADDEGDAFISGVLHGSRDAFLSAASFTFGPMRFKIRGYDAKYTPTYLNGAMLNDMETGRGTWYLWGGLNDVTRNKFAVKGNLSSDFAVGGIGGLSSINTAPSSQRKGTKFAYSLSNKSYMHRAMITHSTGMMKNGWAFTVSGSKRWAEEGYVEGTFYDAYAYFAAVEKKINASHSIILTGFGAPSIRGGQGASTQEVYDLTGNNYYNPYWGWQDGEKRNSRIRNTHKPVFMLNHDWQITEKSSLKTNLTYINGKSHRTSLNWYNADDPRPDYYRFLPSYMEDSLSIAIRTEEFANGERQIDWLSLYQANINGTDTVLNANNTGETLTGNKSEYIVENRHDDEIQYNANTVFKTEMNENYNLIAGVSFRKYIGRHYKTVNDLLGGDFIVDIDKYAERDFPDPVTSQSDIRYPNRIVKVGDVFGYDYDSNVEYGEAWLQNKFSFKKVDFDISGQVSNTSMWRYGNMQNGKFPESSLGIDGSEKLYFLDYSGKLGLTYKIDGRNYLVANAVYLTKAPNFKDLYISSRTRNQSVDNPVSEKIMSVEGSYILRSPIAKLSLSAYYTTFEDQMWVRSFYHDGYGNFVNYALTGIDKVHQGIEFGSEINIIPGFTATAVASLGYYYWNSTPSYSVSVDNSAEILTENETVYAQGFLESGTPQTAASVGLNYRSGGYWFFGVNANYMDDIYLSFNPTRRTEDAVEYLDPQSDQYLAIVEQEQLPDAFTLDASIGKSFRFKRKYYLSINLNVSNIMDNTEFITGGYEQLRYDLDGKDPEKFQPKYYYYYGRTYFLNVSFRF